MVVANYTEYCVSSIDVSRIRSGVCWNTHIGQSARLNAR